MQNGVVRTSTHAELMDSVRSTPSSISCSREDRKVHKNVSTVRIIVSSALKNAVLSIGTIAAVVGAIVTALIRRLCSNAS